MHPLPSSKATWPSFTEEEKAVAFSPLTGTAESWPGRARDETATHATPIAATIHGVRQVIFFCTSGLVAVNPKTGKEIWRQKFPFKVSTAAAPVVAGDLVYCSAGYGVGSGLYRISKDGSKMKSTEVWRKSNEMFNHWSTPIHHDGHLYGMFSFKKYGEGPSSASSWNPGKSSGAKTATARATSSFPETN